MTKQERIEDLEENIRVYTKRLENDRDELERIKDAKELSVSVLIKDWELQREYMTVTKRQGRYEHILGGDGRSMPWSEPRNGTILSIRIKKTIYVSDEDLHKFRQYVKSTCDEDFEIINSFANKMLTEATPIDEEIQNVINDHFWDML